MSCCVASPALPAWGISTPGCLLMHSGKPSAWSLPLALTQLLPHTAGGAAPRKAPWREDLALLAAPAGPCGDARAGWDVCGRHAFGGGRPRGPDHTPGVAPAVQHGRRHSRGSGGREAPSVGQSREFQPKDGCDPQVSGGRRDMATFLAARKAHAVLKRFPRANGFLEEFRQGPIGQECVEEICSYEEVKEVFENKEKTMEFWKGYAYSVKDPADGTGRSDAMYVVVPLLGAALLLIIALFTIWRCQLQKATRPRPSCGQSRSLASRAGCSPPRVMACHEASPSQAEAPCRQDSGSRGAGGGPGPAGRVDRALCPSAHAASALSRRSSATPPPSYEELTGPSDRGSSSGEGAPASYSDSPPMYEEVAAAAAAPAK